MNNIIQLNIIQFSTIYLLLIIVLAIMKHCHINQSKLLILASFRMTIQLILAGFILTYIFTNPHPIFIILYLTAMLSLAIHTALSRNKNINKQLKLITAISLITTALLISLFFITLVVRTSFFNPQYAIPITGMIVGNSMTAVSLALKNFHESLNSHKLQIETLLNIGASPKDILLPFVNKSIELALLPTLNSMLGMGIITLPGMMTGQILSGTLPSTAILYQIAIMIAITAVVCLCTFCTLFFGYKTLYNKQYQIKL